MMRAPCDAHRLSQKSPIKETIFWKRDLYFKSPVKETIFCKRDLLFYVVATDVASRGLDVNDAMLVFIIIYV